MGVDGRAFKKIEGDLSALVSLKILGSGDRGKDSSRLRPWAITPACRERLLPHYLLPGPGNNIEFSHGNSMQMQPRLHHRG